MLILIALLTFTGALLRFYNLSWGAPFYFHPDERNIASSISQLSIPDNLNPKFFAYGSFPIYLIYLTGIYKNLFQGSINFQVLFEDAIVISRVFSAFFATALIPLMFFIGKKIAGNNAGGIAAILTTILTGFIQFAHFGTFEMFLTLGSVLLFYVCLFYIEKTQLRTLLCLAIISGALCAVKVSSLPLLLLSAGVILFATYRQVKKSFFVVIAGRLLLFLLTTALMYIVTNPFVFLDFSSFENSMRYESSLALGTLPVFYTGEFFNTTPLLYPFFHVYPFLTNPLLTIISIPLFIFLFIRAFRKRHVTLLLLFGFFFLLLFSQAFLFVKWTRYYVPTLPFLILIISIAAASFLQSKKKNIKNLALIGTALTLIVSTIFCISYVITAYVEKDTRLQGVEYAKASVPHNAEILSEIYDLGIVPFNDAYPHITLFDFYGLDSVGVLPVTAGEIVRGKDFIILPSQRIVKTRLGNPAAFPNGHLFYQKLFAGTLGYELVYQTPCSVWCQITYLSDPVNSYEGTATVFDRPTVYIFKKTND